MPDWIADNQAVLFWIAGASVVMFVATLAMGPWLILRIPPDYFTHARRPPSRMADHHPVWRTTIRVLRAVLAVVCLVAGLAMLVLPGQGLLTLLMAFLLMEFPGKYRFEQALIRRQRMLRAINAVRRKRGKDPLLAPPAKTPRTHSSGRSGRRRTVTPEGTASRNDRP